MIYTDLYTNAIFLLKDYILSRKRLRNQKLPNSFYLICYSHHKFIEIQRNFIVIPLCLTFI
jgi:hypothetical protein